MRRGEWGLASAGVGRRCAWRFRRRREDGVCERAVRRALLEAGRVEEAEGLACEALERFPEHPGGYVQRAEAAMRCEEWAVACERWEALRRVSPDQSSGYERGAVGAVERGSAGGGGGVGRGGGWAVPRPSGGLCSAGRGVDAPRGLGGGVWALGGGARGVSGPGVGVCAR